MRRKYQRLLAELRDWIADSSNREVMFDEPRRELRQFVESRQLEPTMVANRLIRIRQWLLANGVSSAVRGEIDGLQVIALASDYGVVACEVVARTFGGFRSAPLDSRLVGIGLLESLSLGRSNAASRWYSLIRNYPTTAFFDWSESPVANFAASLWGDHVEPNSKVISLPLSTAYRFCVENWKSEDSDTVVSMFDGLIAEHDRHSREEGDFDDEALRLFPLEIRAVRWLRRCRSLSTEIKSSDSLVSMEELVEIFPKQDDLLQQVEATARR